MANRDDLWESTESIEELRRGDWGFAPEILAAGMDLPRRADGSEYQPAPDVDEVKLKVDERVSPALLGGTEVTVSRDEPVYLDPLAGFGDRPRPADERSEGRDV